MFNKSLYKDLMKIQETISKILNNWVNQKESWLINLKLYFLMSLIWSQLC